VVAKVKERLAVNKQRSHRFHMERFNLKNLNEVECKEQYHVEVLNRITVLEDLDTEGCKINSVWETIRENVKISAKESLGYFELENHKPWFDEGRSKLLDQRKEAKLRWLQDQSEINGDNVNNVRCDASISFRNKKRKYLKDKINELAMNSKNKNIRDLYRGINEFMRGYQLGNN
jgi:50S ribosomal subunit-associated GTPase HflX